MKHSVIVKSLNGDDKMDDLQHSIDIIEGKLDSEIAAKQNTIERQEKEIQRLHALVEEKNQTIIDINEKLLGNISNNEGNKQLINKLLGDMSRLQQDIEWYKKTFEKRNIFGLIKEKMRRKTKN